MDPMIKILSTFILRILVKMQKKVPKLHAVIIDLHQSIRFIPTICFSYIKLVAMEVRGSGKAKSGCGLFVSV